MAKPLADFVEDGDVEEFEDLLVRGLEIPKEVWEKYKKATRPQDPDFDLIAKLCGCPEWDYPGQVLRDVQALVKERDKLKVTVAALRSSVERLDEELAGERQRAQIVILERDATIAALRAEVAGLRATLEDFSERDCAYGDGCPSNAGTRHGTCDGCRARKALGAGLRASAMPSTLVEAVEALGKARHAQSRSARALLTNGDERHDTEVRWKRDLALVNLATDRVTCLAAEWVRQGGK
jgi:hypothetical protein